MALPILLKKLEFDPRINLNMSKDMLNLLVGNLKPYFTVAFEEVDDVNKFISEITKCLQELKFTPI